MTLEKLKTNTRKELAALAKRHRVAGWHGMRKEELIEALLDVDRSKAAETSRSLRSVARVKTERQDPRPPSPPRPTVILRPPGDAYSRTQHANGHSHSNGHSTQHPVPARPNGANGRPVRKDISTVGPHERVHEELTAVAHDPYWIHVRWVLKRSTVLRAEAALGAEWFRAVPVVRVFALDIDEVKGAAAHFVRDVEIHGECDHWFVPVENPPGSYKLEIGYAAPSGRFFALAKSRRVTTPRPGSKAAERIGWNRGNGAGHSHRPANGRSVTDPQFEKFLAVRAVSYAVGHVDHHRTNGQAKPRFPFTVETELVLSGTSQPNAQLTFQGETVRVGRDGRFSMRVALGDGRQVFPATAISPDGTEQRTIIVAVERNTKELAPQSLDELN